MKGITPVIAIILLLLMAVAAAGGFYIVYQNFASSGEESGSSQIEQLGEQSLTQLTIESVAAGKVYVRNVGASSIDTTKLTVYVDNVPYSVNVSSESLAENSRATLKFTQAPDCASTKCEIRVSGTTSASLSVESARLSCASDGECSYGESCSGGVCIAGATGCGDSVCSGSENGMNCFSDCGPRSMALGGIDTEDGDGDTYVFDWNGSTYVKGQDLSNNGYNDVIVSVNFDSSGKALGIAVTGNGWADPDSETFWVYYDGSDWSESDNISSNDRPENGGFWGHDFNSSGEAIATWTTGYGLENVAWASFDGTSWSVPANLTDNTDGGIRIDGPGPDFEFGSDDKGYVVWPCHDGDSYWVNYTFWDNGWSTTGTIQSIEDNPYEQHIHLATVSSNSTHFIAVWALTYDYLSDYNAIQWSVSDGSGWSAPQNLTPNAEPIGMFSVEPDSDGSWVLTITNVSSTPTWNEWYTWDGGWNHEGNLTTEPDNRFAYLKTNQNDALFATLHSSTNYLPEAFTYWDGTVWSEPVEFG